MDDTDARQNWKRMRFKRNKVWLAVDDEGHCRIENGKALIKYQLDQPHQYWVHPDNIQPLEQDPSDQPTERSAKRPGSAQRSSRPVSRPQTGQPDAAEANPADAICIYTDGACSGNPGPAGIGVILLYQGHHREISRYIGVATNNIAELKAIKAGLESVKNRDLPVVVYTDSSYSLGVLAKGWKAKQNLELVEQVRNLTKQFKRLRFVKVKGHSGHPDNELADRLAVDAIQRGK